jgi:hypothetical protein
MTLSKRATHSFFVIPDAERSEAIGNPVRRKSATTQVTIGPGWPSFRPRQ